MEIKHLSEAEINEYIALVLNVYNKFVAPDYSEEGNNTFYNYLTYDAVFKRYKSGNIMLVAKNKDEISGVLEVRGNDHISLFFVKRKYMHMGIGKMLFAYYLNELKVEKCEVEKITVNSSPYAVEIYKKMGFVEISSLQEKDGIKFIEMSSQIT